MEVGLQQAETLRFGIFVLLLLSLLLLQYVLPRRELPRMRWRGTCNNLLLVGLGNLLTRAFLPMGLIFLAQSKILNFGLLPSLGIDGILALCIGVILLDCALYWQHRLFHVVPFFWRLHRVHHSDPGFEVTTAVRFHPFELLLSSLLKAALIIFLGVTTLTVLVFEIMLSSAALFTHSNLALPLWADRVLRILVVTPDMHRIHHSQLVSEHNNNYGFFLSIWDKLFSSYTQQPQKGHKDMQIGLANLADGNIIRLLVMPFLSHSHKEKNHETGC